MQINLNNYKHSRINTLGSNLKQPLFKLISNTIISLDQLNSNRCLIWRISNVFIRCLLLAIFIIPAALTSFAGKCLIRLGKTQINYRNLSLAPQEIQLPQIEENDHSIDIKLLSTKFDNLSDLSSEEEKHKKGSLELLCNKISKNSKSIYPHSEEKRTLFCKEVSIYLKGIIKKLNSGEISEEKERSILLELAEASTRCYPTWLETAARLFGEVNGQSETVEIKLLRIVQEYKEAVILDFCQKEVDAQWHALNSARNIAGKELGLNTSLNQFDPYAMQSSSLFGKSLVKWLFLQRYENVNRLISVVQMKINSQEYDSSYHTFLVEKVRNLGIEDPENYVTENFYSEIDCSNDYAINQIGVNFLLKSIGILK